MDNVCIPIHLDAFAISPGCCSTDTKEASLAPYTQPNYTSLRLDSHLIQHDVLDHVDMHLSAPAWRNPRLADLSRAPGNPPGKNYKRQRMGIHLSWSLPRFYRSATASGKSANPESNPQPRFRPFPNRWLVVRQVTKGDDAGKLRKWQSWVVESDSRQYISRIRQGVDLESDVSPFVSGDGSAQDISQDDGILQAQTEVFLGQKFDTMDWSEDTNRDHMKGLTIMSSSNPLFADNALHNTNVLSMIDTLAYADGSGFVEKCECNYSVFGWHSTPSDDPFQDKKDTGLTARLSELMLQLDAKKYPTPTDSTVADVKVDARPRRCILYGAIYNVKYDFNYDSKNVNQDTPESLANTSARKFSEDVKMEPLSVGTTPLDSVLTFLEAHKADVDTVFGPGSTDLADSLMSIAQLLYATGDNYDSRVQAQDLIAQQNFSRADGGSRWIFAKTTKPGEAALLPTDEESMLLAKLNELQDKQDTANRQLASLKWELFAEWWKQVSKYIPAKQEDAINGPIRGEVERLRQKIKVVESQVDGLKLDLKNNQNPTTAKITTKSPFQTRTDPTLCIAGLKSGWPSDWQDTLTIRLQRELTGDDGIADTIFKDSRNPMPSELLQSSRQLLTECLQNSTSTTNGARDAKTKERTAPKVTGFQTWGNQNPFIPMFVEWEGIYYHVGPDEKSPRWQIEKKWEVKLRPSPVGHVHQTLRYVPTESLAKDPANHKDFRSVSGRALILPQPVFSLETLVKSVLDSASEDVKLEKTKREELYNNIRQIQFISAPLAGLTNHLLTRFEGAHVKPLVRVQGDRKPMSLKAAERTKISMDRDTIQLIDAESAVTPYGDSFPFGQDQYPGTPFKAVTHGQLIMTKLNVVDKFGQVISLPKMLRRERRPREIPITNIFPCISDWLSPDIIQGDAPGSLALNTVLPTADPVVSGKWPMCQYIQLPPAINQDARINGSFLIRDTSNKEKKQYTRFREASDYDPVIWGWVIINYADNGLQFFRGDGRFYREIRRGGALGTTVSAKWLPYPPPPSAEAGVPNDAGEAQLADFIDIVKDPVYFQQFSDMINGSIKNMPFPPSDYSGYANAIVGKPLALVNVGWSLELAAPAIKSQNTIGNPADDPEGVLSKYTFPLKIGDIARNYDGVVGYWMTDDVGAPVQTHWEKMYSYFVVNWENLPEGHVLQIPGQVKTYTVGEGETITDIARKLNLTVAAIKKQNPLIREQSDKDTFIPIAPHNFLNLNPYYLDFQTQNLGQARADKHRITTMLIDPYTSVHGYSPILPTKTLTLPQWTIETAFKNMHAFFHLGPMLLTSDMPNSKQEAQGTVQKPGLVKLPVSGKKGTWTWFQPYAVDGQDKLDPEYAEMQVQEDLGEEKFAKGPYTFVEGFLQLMGQLNGKPTS